MGMGRGMGKRKGLVSSPPEVIQGTSCNAGSAIDVMVATKLKQILTGEVGNAQLGVGPGGRADAADGGQKGDTDLMKSCMVTGKFCPLQS